MSRRKALKVVDLKDILSRAHVSVTGKANKADLIAKILSSPGTVAIFEGNASATVTSPSEETPKDTHVDPEPETVRASHVPFTLVLKQDNAAFHSS